MGQISRDRLNARTIEVFDRLLARGDITEREELEVLGASLYRALFFVEAEKSRITLHADFTRTMEEVEKEKGTMRVVLAFEEAAEKLAAYPWEYLYYPDGEALGYFIATQERLILVRHTPNVLELPPIPREPLRILLVVAKPEGKDSSGRRWSRILDVPVKEAIGRLRDNAGIEAQELQPATKDELTAALKRYRPHVLHFVGHGEYRDGKGALIFVNDEGDGDRVSELELVNCFAKAGHDPHLVFLHACEGARTDSYGSFRGVALKLLYGRKIPAIVAMQYQIENEVANLFATAFYEALGKGFPLDQAVQEGRKVLGSYLEDGKKFRSRAFGSPVVFMQNVQEIVLPQVVRQNVDGSAKRKLKEAECPWPGCPQILLASEDGCRKCGNAVEQCLSRDCEQPLRMAGKACASCKRGEQYEVAPAHREHAPAQPPASTSAASGEHATQKPGTAVGAPSGSPEPLLVAPGAHPHAQAPAPFATNPSSKEET